MPKISVTRDRPNFGYGYSFGAETGSKVSFCPVSVSANQGSAKLRLRPQPPQSFGRLPKLHSVTDAQPSTSSQTDTSRTATATTISTSLCEAHDTWSKQQPPTKTKYFHRMNGNWRHTSENHVCHDRQRHLCILALQPICMLDNCCTQVFVCAADFCRQWTVFHCGRATICSLAQKR